jgi:hypothetical protein
VSDADAVVNQATPSHCLSVPILSEGSTSLGEGQLSQGGLVVNEFACPCSLTLVIYYVIGGICFKLDIWEV